MIVALAGATGLTGGFCLEYLLQDTQVSKVVCIVRKPLQIIHPKLEQVLLVENKLSAPVKANAFISCLGTTIKKAGSKEAFESIDRHLPVHLATMLYQEGCQIAAVVSSMGTSKNAAVFYSRVKWKMENDMQHIGLGAVHILRPSIIDGNRKEHRAGERFFLKFTKLMHPLMIGSLKHFKAIEASTIAKALVHCIHQPAKGHFVYLSDDIKQLVNK
jgi:uncharacterized protein YbjT (DUF2867 family)